MAAVGKATVASSEGAADVAAPHAREAAMGCVGSAGAAQPVISVEPMV